MITDAHLLREFNEWTVTNYTAECEHDEWVSLEILKMKNV